MPPRLDITKNNVAYEVKAAVANCPYCGRGLRESQRLSYPPQAIGAFASVYRCTCGRHIGAPIGKE